MRSRIPRFIISALMSGALFDGCAGGGSSVSQSAGAVPSAVQRGIAPGGASVGRQAHSGVRRTMSVPTCSGSGTDSFVGGGVSNVAGAVYSFVGDGASNQACDVYAGIVGGYENAASGSGNNGYGFIGGGANNVLTGDDTASAVVAGNANEVSNAASAIVGGTGNAVSSSYGFIGGGFENTLSGEYGFLGGGNSNAASGEYAFIGSGLSNKASAEGAVVGGGYDNNASGVMATIPGGYVDVASGVYSFAAGARASASQEGTFVWSDGSDGDTILTSSRAYQFLARASGGFTLWTNAASTVGATLAAGSGTWASASDRRMKTDVVRIDDASVLDKVASLPISKWSYKSEHGVRHVGPMAQDFYAAFGVGEDDKHITSIDEDGVALAAIKALHAQEAASHAAIAILHSENDRLRRELLAERAHDRRVDSELAHIAAVLRK